MPSRQPHLPLARHRGFPSATTLGLVLVDFQRAFVEPTSKIAVSGAAEAMRHAVQLARSFARARLPIVVTRHAHSATPLPGGMGTWWSRFLSSTEPGSALMPEILHAAPHTLIRKQHYSAFKATNLDRRLRESGVTDVVLAGVMTHVCVDTTARDAFMRGFNVVVIHDACASKDAVLHQASLMTLSHAVARVCSTRQAIAALRRLQR